MNVNDLTAKVYELLLERLDAAEMNLKLVKALSDDPMEDWEQVMNKKEIELAEWDLDYAKSELEKYNELYDRKPERILLAFGTYIYWTLGPMGRAKLVEMLEGLKNGLHPV